MANGTLGDRWAFGNPHRPSMGRKKIYVPLIAVITAMFTLAMVGIAAATDQLLADGVISTTPVDNQALDFGSVCPGGTYPSPSAANVALAIQRGNNNTNRFADAALVTVDFQAPPTEVDQTGQGTLSAAVTAPGTIQLAGWNTAANGDLSASVSSTVTLTVPATATASGANPPYTGGVNYVATGDEEGGGTNTRPHTLDVQWKVLASTDAACSSGNTAPDPGTISGDDSVDEASTGGIYTSDASDTDGPDPLTYQWSVVGNATINGSSTGSGVTLDFGDGCATCTATLSLEVSDGEDTASPADLVIDVNNLPPTVTASFVGSVDCRADATLNVDFDDPYDSDGDWDINIDWGDGSTDTTDSQSADEPDPDLQYSHAYASPGAYTATVTVTDKDGALDNGQGSTTAGITITQEYMVTFLPPFDVSNATQAVINKAKAGRVVPVKVKIFDVCAQEYLTDGDPLPYIGVNTANGITGADTDTLEAYADAGSANGNDKYFRWSADGFWIYNLDTRKILDNFTKPLVTGSSYRINVFDNAGVRATDDEWALLKCVK